MKLKESPRRAPGVLPFDLARIHIPGGVRHGALFVDYDGTLAPIAAHPGGARMPALVRRALIRVADQPGWTVSIVSGRQLADVRERVGLPRLIYAGNHGYEIAFPGQPVFVHPAAKAVRPLIKAILSSVRLDTARLPGVLVEDKQYGISLHTRLASVGDERRAHLALMHAARDAVRRGDIVIRRGKKVLEVRPAARWDKGRAVSTIIESLNRPVLAVYFGDDNTDEDAFRALRRGGVTVRVGKGESNAHFFIPSVSDVPRTLQALLTLFPERRGAPGKAGRRGAAVKARRGDGRRSSGK